MDERTRTQLLELQARWLAMGPTSQEAILLLTRMLSDNCRDMSGADLVHFQAYSEESDRRWQQRQSPENDASQPG